MTRWQMRVQILSSAAATRKPKYYWLEKPKPLGKYQKENFCWSRRQLLDKILQSAEFDPEADVYITNSVFRMPPGDAGKNFRKPNDKGDRILPSVRV